MTDWPPFLKRFFNITTLRRGESCLAEQGDLHWARVDDFYEAEFPGSEGAVYRVRLLMKDGEIWSASCACPSRKRCKHMAALAIWIVRLRKDGASICASDPV